MELEECITNHTHIISRVLRFIWISGVKYSMAYIFRDEPEKKATSEGFQPWLLNWSINLTLTCLISVTHNARSQQSYKAENPLSRCMPVSSAEFQFILRSTERIHLLFSPVLINLCLYFSFIFRFHHLTPLRSVYSRHWHCVGSTTSFYTFRRSIHTHTQRQRTIIEAPCHSLWPVCLHSFSLSLGLIINAGNLFKDTTNYPVSSNLQWLTHTLLPQGA